MEVYRVMKSRDYYMRLKKVYDLKDDFETIKIVQKVSLDKSSDAGFKIEYGLLFGSKEWFTAMENGLITKHVINGFISRVYMSGHNDYPEFEIESNEGTTIWKREGNDAAYKVGSVIELVYVEQRYKRPIGILGLVSKCIIEIRIAV